MWSRVILVLPWRNIHVYEFTSDEDEDEEAGVLSQERRVVKKQLLV